MDDFHLLSKDTKKINNEIYNIRRDSSELEQSNSEQRIELDDL